MTSWRLSRLLALFMLATTDTAIAVEINGYPPVQAADPREVAMLPPYCPHTQTFRDRVPGGNDAQAINRWGSSIGPVFSAMHHYCWGLMKTNRALFLAKDKRTKDYYLRSSIDEFNYVIDRAPPEFILLPEILTKKGENLIRLGDGPVGVAILDRAIELKQDYSPAYAALSDYYKEQGQMTAALQVLEKGLEAAPAAKALRRRLNALSSTRATTDTVREKRRTSPQSPLEADRPTASP